MTLVGFSVAPPAHPQIGQESGSVYLNVPLQPIDTLMYI